MISFSKFFLEYRHNLADGTPTPSIQAHNGKDPNRINKKILHTVGPYKAKEERFHKLGATYSGNVLLDMLADYGMDFLNGEVSKIKSSPYGIQMFLNSAGTPVGKIIKVK